MYEYKWEDCCTYEIKPQTDPANILQLLAHMKEEGFSLFCLNLVKDYGFSLSDTWDALAAYSLYPLGTLPEEVMAWIETIDWSKEYNYHQLAAICWAGDACHLGINLEQLLETLGSDFRDGVLFAAAATNKRSVVDTTLKVIHDDKMADMVSGGEHGAFRYCLLRWLESGLIDEIEIRSLKFGGVPLFEVLEDFEILLELERKRRPLLANPVRIHS
ncbi:MAG: hypothetical protein R3C45_20970 [Phycisphaerales bacterium]